jgi:3'(2'), 5'-bisphosphate nucleotidase
MEISHQLQKVVDIGYSVGELILEHYRNGVTPEEKIGADQMVEPVTIADKEASKFIVSALAEAFPDDFILSEEEPDKAEARLGSRRVWMVDPIDGTAGFIKRDGDFAVQIGLVENGEPILGVVYMPAHGEMMFAERGGGAYLAIDGGAPEKISASDLSVIPSLKLAVSRNHRSPRMNRVVEDFGIKEELQRGSVGLKVSLIARKICDIYIHLSPRTKYWDTCGPHAIIIEAGGRMTDLFGTELRYDSADVQNLNGIVTSNGNAHDVVIERLQPLLQEFGRRPA